MTSTIILKSHGTSMYLELKMLTFSFLEVKYVIQEIISVNETVTKKKNNNYSTII